MTKFLVVLDNFTQISWVAINQNPDCYEIIKALSSNFKQCKLIQEEDQNLDLIDAFLLTVPHISITKLNNRYQKFVLKASRKTHVRKRLMKDLTDDKNTKLHKDPRIREYFEYLWRLLQI